MVHNIATLAPAPRIITVDPSVPEPKREGYGKVPTYLESRKAEWAAKSEKERKEKEIRDACPPGHRMMPEEERLETLSMVTSALEIAKKEVSGATHYLCTFLPSFFSTPYTHIHSLMHIHDTLPRPPYIAVCHALESRNPLCLEEKG